MDLAEDQVHHLLRVATSGLESLYEPVEHDQSLRVYRGNRYQSSVSHERAQDARHVGRLVAVLDGTGLARGFRACRDRECLAEQVHIATITPQDETGVDQSLQGTARGARIETARLPHGVSGRCSQYERGNDPAAILVGEEPDELAWGERRSGHAH